MTVQYEEFDFVEEIPLIDVPLDNMTRRITNPDPVHPEMCAPRIAFKNTHLSVSRLERYEQCPLSFKMQYVEKVEREKFNAATDFGSLLHDVLERTYKWIVDEEFSGPFPIDKITEFYRLDWDFRGCTGFELYNEGLSIVREYGIRQPIVDSYRILGIELEFNIQVEEFLVNGYIDRIDKVNDTTIRIIDYKSNRLMYTREQLESNLQMSVYALAVKEKFPWVKEIEYEFHMLRYGGMPMTTKRSEKQIDDARDYVVSLGRRTENDPIYPAKLNMNCGFCDVRKKCIEFNRAMKIHPEDVGYPVNDTDSLEQIVLERERMAALAKLLYKRKDTLDDILKIHLETKGTLEVAGFIYSMNDWNKARSYPIDSVVRAVSRVLHHPEGDTLRDICNIDHKKVQMFLERMSDVYPRAKVLLLQAEIEALEIEIPGNPKLYSKRTKDAKTIQTAQNPGVRDKSKEPKAPSIPRAPRAQKATTTVSKKKVAKVIEDLD